MDHPTEVKNKSVLRQAMAKYKREMRQLEQLSKEFGLSKEEICQRLGVPMPKLEVVGYRETDNRRVTVTLQAS